MIRKHNAQYSYILFQEDKVVAITDRGSNGNMTVTNAIEDVISEILSKESDIVNVTDWHFIYEDSNGDIDGYNPMTGRFYFIGARNWGVAIEKLK